MPTYYAVIPGYEQWSAEVDARDKRKARTAYLDLLVRKLKVAPYSLRQSLRELAVMERIEPGDASVRYKISYDGGTEVVPQAPLSAEQVGDYRTAEAEGGVPLMSRTPVPQAVPVEVASEAMPETLPTETPIAQVPPMSPMSPIMNVSRRSGGS